MRNNKFSLPPKMQNTTEPKMKGKYTSFSPSSAFPCPSSCWARASIPSSPADILISSESIHCKPAQGRGAPSCSQSGCQMSATLLPMSSVETSWVLLGQGMDQVIHTWMILAPGWLLRVLFRLVARLDSQSHRNHSSSHQELECSVSGQNLVWGWYWV